MSNSILQTLIKTYCLYSFICFDHDSTSLIDCPNGCHCYSAYFDEDLSQKTFSLYCNQSDSIKDKRFVDFNLLNTLVIDLTHKPIDLQSNQFASKQEYLINVQHLVLQGFTGRLKDIQKPSIFDWLDVGQIQTLSLIEWTNRQILFEPIRFKFILLQHFSRLQILRFESCTLEIIDQDFNDVSLYRLHTLIVNESKLNYIHRHAFHRIAEQFRKIQITKNKLTNLKWITSVPGAFDLLWYLDLSENHLRILPIGLIEKLPKLKVFYVQKNNFKYFQYESLRRLFAIQEFRLSGQDSTSILYMNDQMKWLNESLLTTSEIRSMFTIDSFINHYSYCIVDKSMMKMDQLLTEWAGLTFRSFIPEKLFFQDHSNQGIGHLVINQCDINPPQMNDPVFVVGLEVSRQLIRYEDSFFRTIFWLEDSMHKTKAMRNLKPSIKLPIMDGDMFELLSTGKSKRSSAQIELWIDTIVHLLDIAYIKNHYVIFTLWPYEFFKNLKIPDDWWKAQRFQDIVLRPLLDEIQDHPALIGIEIVDKAFQSTIPDFRKDFDPDSNRGCPYNAEFIRQIQDEINFIEFHMWMLTETTTGSKPLIGIGIDSDCKPCLPLLLIKQCAFSMNYDPLDFIIIYSPFDNPNTEYAYQKLATNFDQWFQRHPLMKPLKRIFYSIHGDIVKLPPDHVKMLKNYTIGYYTPHSYDPIDL